MDLSFIIPAYNEAKNIKNVIASIKQFVPEKLQYEIIVVDHGSTDDTVKLVENSGGKVLVHPQGTIAGLRNYGVSYSSGNILVFLDADIILTAEWSLNIGGVAASLKNGERLLTGSWSSIPDNPTWIEKYWFKPLERGGNTHINSGHLIIARSLFDEIGGFDERLETGEDYEISMRAKVGGIRICDDVKLRVIHEGFPKTLAEFTRREFWHGKGDAATLGGLCQSKVAMVALMFLALHLALLYYGYQQAEIAAMFVLVGIVVIVIGMATVKYRNESLLTILINSGIYYVYFWARGLSVLSFPGLRNTRKRLR